MAKLYNSFGVSMAVTDAPRTDAEVVEASQESSHLSAWSGLIAAVTYILIGLLAVGLVSMLVINRAEDARVEAKRVSFDKVFEALKDKNKTNERLAALESVWAEVDGEPAHPYVMTLLAREHWELSVREERPPAARTESREKAAQIYNLIYENYGESKAYGPVALEGAALAEEMNGDYAKAIELLKKGVNRYEGHFLYPVLNYHLARNLYMNAAKEGHADDLENADVVEARRMVTTALTSTKDSQYDFFTWRKQAKFLRSLVEKTGPGLSIDIPPAPAAKAEDETGDEAAEGAADERGDAAEEEKKPAEDAEKKPEAPKAEDKKPDAEKPVDAKKPVEKKPEAKKPVDTKKPVENKPE